MPKVDSGGRAADAVQLLAYLEASSFRAAFAADLPVATTRLMQATQRPFSAACFTDVTTAAAWHTIPSWGLVADADKAIPPALQRFFYQRAGAHKVVDVPGASHVAMMSHPGITARLVKDAASPASPDLEEQRGALRRHPADLGASWRTGAS